MYSQFVVQQLKTEAKKTIYPYRPLFSDISNNLKRGKIWPSLEVHAIYSFIYTICTDKAGLLPLKSYFLAGDPNIYDPVFIAQYLLVPVNTIVKDSLLL